MLFGGTYRKKRAVPLPHIEVNDTAFVVYAERAIVDENGKPSEVIRMILARLDTNFERGVYYGKRN